VHGEWGRLKRTFYLQRVRFCVKAGLVSDDVVHTLVACRRGDQVPQVLVDRVHSIPASPEGGETSRVRRDVGVQTRPARRTPAVRRRRRCSRQGHQRAILRCYTRQSTRPFPVYSFERRRFFAVGLGYSRITATGCHRSRVGADGVAASLRAFNEFDYIWGRAALLAHPPLFVHHGLVERST